MGLIEKLFDKYNEFIKFETIDIEDRLRRHTEILGFYQSTFYTMKQKHTKYSFELDRQWQEKYLYYKNEFNIVLNNNEIKSFIEKDLEYLEIKRKLQEVTDILEQIELILKGLDSMRWTIKSIIDWEKFKAGQF